MYSEKVNPEICQKLSILSFTKFKEFYAVTEDEVGNYDSVKVQFNLLKKYCQLQKESNYNLERDYKFSIGNDKGRLFVKDIGIQRIWNKFRGILCQGIGFDFDMKNAHPTLLSYICKKKKINCFELDSYINNRDKFLNDLTNTLEIDKDEAKKLILKSMNKNVHITEFNKKKIKCESFINLDKCFKNIQKNLFDLSKKEDKKNKKIKSEYNQEGKLLNRILCYYENICLQLAINKVKDFGTINSLMFDGFMMETDKDLEKIIQMLNISTKKYKIKWTNKEHNLELLDEIKKITNDDNIYSFVENTEKDLAIKCLDTFLKDKIITCNDNFYMLDPEQDIWINDTKTIKRKLRCLVSKHDLYCLDDNDKPVLVSKCQLKLVKFCEMILDNIKENNDFLEYIYYVTKYKIKFNNGYYDFKKKEFITNVHLDSFIKINRDFKYETDEESKKKIYEKVLNPIFSVEEENTDQSKLRDYFLYKQNRVFGGYNEDKDFYTLLGERGSGKGVYSDLAKNTFEKYVDTTNSDHLLKRKQISEDPSKQRHWMVDLRFTRLVITQEIQNDEGIILDGIKIKNMCSGGDIIKARKLNQNEESFRMQCSLLLCANDMPVIKPTDTLEKLISFNLKSIFVNDSFKDDEKLKGFKYYKQDPNIKNELRDEKLINAFFHIIINAEKCEYPKNLLKENKENEDEDDNDKQKLFDLFVFTGLETDRIYNKNLKDILKDEKINISPSKAKRYLICKGALHYVGNGQRGLKNLKLKNDDFDDEL